ncbi:unnamed protein product [Acanthoscelides obtectus]|uniref:Secreted protein n=1 Tax=Acanthoscelides obtectus TaxID=200917 RepID=A0A9P0K3D5_ACAOB|nr:unnamed protein product [Acanthoscelides obtectus]CAK1623457.1 hypothetical protein AOBTE_LOCUS2014 [Acanthoscelides obtectus]
MGNIKSVYSMTLFFPVTLLRSCQCHRLDQLYQQHQPSVAHFMLPYSIRSERSFRLQIVQCIQRGMFGGVWRLHQQ